MNVVLQKRYVITRRLSPVCPGTGYRYRKRSEKGIIPDDQSGTSGQNASPPQEDQTAREKRREALQKLLARINTQHQDARPPVVAAAMWSTTGAPGTALMRHRPVPLHHSIPVCRRRVWQHRQHVRDPADTGTDPRTGLHRHRSGL